MCKVGSFIKCIHYSVEFMQMLQWTSVFSMNVPMPMVGVTVIRQWSIYSSHNIYIVFHCENFMFFVGCFFFCVFFFFLGGGGSLLSTRVH